MSIRTTLASRSDGPPGGRDEPDQGEIVDVPVRTRLSPLEEDGFEPSVPRQKDAYKQRDRHRSEAADARRAHIAIRTYLSTGIRLAFSPGVRDESKLAMGGEEFIETMPPDLRAGARPFAFFDKEGLVPYELSVCIL